MSDCTNVFPETVGLDPNKRVNYVHGLVLGVDEFLQEELYLLEKDRLHNRSLHGHGTVCGLSISKEDTDAGPQIKVNPGIAVSQSGQIIQVSKAQCALLNEWLASPSHSEEIERALGSPANGPLSLYLMLCYRQCKTDQVPIPAGPCQSLEESSAASRIADDFYLSFKLDPPTEHLGEAAMQDLLILLQTIPVEDSGGELSLEDIKELVRSLSPVGSPPQTPPPITHIRPSQVIDVFNTALTVWVTEVKPCLLTGDTKTIPGDSYQNCVMLARLEFDVETIESITRVVGDVDDVLIDETQRPYLLSTRFLQNYLCTLNTTLSGLSGLSLPAITPIDQSTLVHLDRAETITGSKSFSAPLILSGAGRVQKRIVLPAYQAHHGRGAAKALFSNTLPSMHFMTTGTNAFIGEALFSIPIADDIDYAHNIQFRLLWGFQGVPDPADIAFTWLIGARFFTANDSVLAAPLETVEVPVEEVGARRNDVLITDFMDFNSSISLRQEHQYGAMRVFMENPGTAIPQIYLLQVELRYIADRLGSALP